MGLFDWLGDALFGDPQEEAPRYQAPATYQAPVIPTAATTYQPEAGDNLSSLGALFSQLLNQYQTTGSATAPGVEEAMMDEARRGVQYDTEQASNQISEQMNRMNLLNSTAHGTAQGINQQSGLRNLLDAQSRVLQQRQANAAKMMNFGSGLTGAFAQRARDRVAPAQWGYGQQVGNAQYGYDQGMKNAANQYASDYAMFSGLMGLAGSAVGGGMFGRGGGGASTGSYGQPRNISPRR